MLSSLVLPNIKGSITVTKLSCVMDTRGAFE